jgi:hypothetical protein
MPNIHFVKMSEEEFVKEAIGIVEKAHSRGLELRILGSLATYIQSLNDGHADVFRSLERFGEGQPLFTDLDLAAYGKQRGELAKFMRELNFAPNMVVNGMFGRTRQIYYHPQNKYHIDVFLNKLEFSHDVNFGEKPGSGRLELNYPTISPADIVLEKVQIHQINRKDLIDLVALFLIRDVQEQPAKDAIDGAYISKVLANDWGFWYDATTNLTSVKTLVGQLTIDGKITDAQSQTVMQRIDKLLNLIANTPKSRDWEKRAKTGTSKVWYREVEEVVR